LPSAKSNLTNFHFFIACHSEESLSKEIACALGVFVEMVRKKAVGKMPKTGEGKMEILLRPIGYIRSPFLKNEDIPRQSTFAKEHKATLELLEEYRDGLKGVKAGKHYVLLFYFHQAGDAYRLQFQKRDSEEVTGIFATRSPHRPNKIGMSIVQFINIEENRIEFSGVDMLDGTPVLDIKPYVAELNPEDEERCFK